MLEQWGRKSAPEKVGTRLSLGIAEPVWRLEEAKRRGAGLLYYGDIKRCEDPRSVRNAIAQKLDWIEKTAPGRERHEALVRVFIEAGELVQGLADQEFEATGADHLSDIQNEGGRFLLSLAKAVKDSWRSGSVGSFHLREGWRSILERLDSPRPIRLKRAEGYAFYCLYPENYLATAAASGLTSKTVVIGLRSIGTSLAALVAAALDADPAFTLRPTGHPFERRVAIAPALAETILKDPSCDFAIVDEGPGLSGSSFGCVADWLMDQGVAPRRIHFFPSHSGGLGPQASQMHRSLWDKLPRHVVAFDDEATGIDRKVGDWAAELTGETVGHWEDISGGAWRQRRYQSHEHWPAVHRSMEKRKFLLHSEERCWLVKFAGLDDLARQRISANAALAEAGFTPRQAGAVYGFQVQEWLPSAAPPSTHNNDDVIDAIGRYLGFRARHLAAPHGGASVTELRAMAIFNTECALGSDLAGVLKEKLSDVGFLSHQLRRVDTDNRLHRWEWLLTADGKMLKADAVDHCAAHDLVGCQDVAWDIAGAAVEFGFSETERARLAQVVAAEAQSDATDSTLGVFEYCYLGFQIGLWTYARMAASGDEAARIDTKLRYYTDRMTLLLRQ